MRTICAGNDALKLELGMSRAAVEAGPGSLGGMPETAAAAPPPGVGGVLVRVQTRDVGMSPTRRWAPLDLPPIIGYDLPSAGVGAVAAGPPSATWFTPEIFGDRDGKHARYLVTEARFAAGTGADDVRVDVAALRLPIGTAGERLLRRLDVRPGDSVLLSAASGAVGPFAVQLTSARTPRGKLVTVVWSCAGRSAWTTVWRGNRAVPRRR